MAKIGRPKREFTDEEIEKIEQMSLDNCHVDTIALALGIPLETLRRNYGVFISQKRAKGRVLLSHQQKDKCAKGDTTMLIWRGKQDLGQADKQETALSGQVNFAFISKRARDDK